MSLGRWLGRMFRSAPPPIETVQARAAAARIGHTADRLNDRLSKYKEARDPFAAMLADLYNRDQVERIWRGRPSD